MTPSPAPRRKRPHPARRSRRLAGWLSVAALAGLTGCMTAATKTDSTATVSPSTTSTTTASSAATSDSDTSWSSRSANRAAVAGSTSDQTVTSSHAS